MSVGMFWFDLNKRVYGHKQVGIKSDTHYIVIKQSSRLVVYVWIEGSSMENKLSKIPFCTCIAFNEGWVACAYLPHICKKNLVLSISLKVCLSEGLFVFDGVLKWVW